MPNAIASTGSLVGSGELNWFVVLLVMVMMLLVIAFIIFMETSQRRIPVQYAKRVVGRKMYGGQSTHLPLKVNTAGVIPPIFASSIIMFPATIANFINHPYMKRFAEYLTPGSVLHELLYVAFIIFFCFFYTAIVFNPDNVADNMKKYGGYIPGIRPGKKTSEYIEKVLSPHHVYRGDLHLVCLRASDGPGEEVQRSLLFRRYCSPYSGGRGSGYDTADRIAPDSQAL